MSDSFRDRLQEEVPEWIDEGIVDASQAQRILERYEAGAPSTAEVDTTSSVLYATAAILLGAAAIALVLVGIDPADPEGYFFGLGVGLALAGLGLHAMAPERDLVVDALLAASMVPLAASTFDGGLVLYPIAAVGLPVAFVAWRTDQPFLPTLSVIGFTAAAAGAAFSEGDFAPQTDAQKTTVWLTGQSLFLAGLTVYDRWRDAALSSPVALAVLGAAGSMIPFLDEVFDLSSVTTELVIGAALLVVLGIAVVLRHRGLSIGVSVGLGVDAIVFAFDVDEIFGTVVLVVLGSLVIWQAETLRGWLAEPG